MRKVRCPYSQSCNLGIAAENDGGQQVCVHDMRKLPVMYFGPWDHFHLAQNTRNTSSESLFSLPHLKTRFPNGFNKSSMMPLFVK